MGIEASWNRNGHTPAATMTSAARGAQRNVARMIEPGIEALHSRERFDGPGLHVGMTDRAYWTSRVFELLRMASLTWCMIGFSGQGWLR
jgi:hypothetical protein